MNRTDAPLRIGWSSIDITPPETTLVVGQFHARVSEGVADPLTCTVLALDAGDDHVVMASCDLCVISMELRDTVRDILGRHADGINPMKVVLNATHTHTGPPVRTGEAEATPGSYYGVDLPVMPVEDYVAFAAEKIAKAVMKAWSKRSPGKFAYGLGYAVIGRNRRAAYVDGASAMYGQTDRPDFDHIEGYEDHSVNLLATYDDAGALTGLAVNVPCPSQLSEHEFHISADYWHETRIELRRRLGENLFVLPQCSAAGDQSPRPIYEKQANVRMHELLGRTPRQEAAHRIATAVEEILPAIAPTAEAAAPLHHHVETLDLPANALTEKDVETCRKEAAVWRKRYEELKAEIDADPSIRETPRWYVEVTKAYRRMNWYARVEDRFNRQKTDPTQPAEIHVIRLGDLALATNPFEYYLDFGILIKARSKALQTMLVQLAGSGSYVPSPRSVAGGGYGSMPSSNPIGPAGGRQLAERTLEVIEGFWPEAESPGDAS